MKLEKSTLKENETITISGSKSISNRLLILNQLFENTIIIENLSNSRDTEVLQAALNSSSELIDIHHAGTAMRFLTAYFAIQEGRTTILTGSHRMKQRPIKYLVEALQHLGADICYMEEEGFPPLKIVGKKIAKSTVSIPANISSQFISALMLIGAKLENGLRIQLEGEISSRPYLEMTLKIMRNIGIQNQWQGQLVEIAPNIFSEKNSQIIKFMTESDWSSASYYYSMAAIGRKTISLKCFRPYSLQGDSIIKELYWQFFGVNTISEDSESKITLMPNEFFDYPKKIKVDMNDCPDIAQTLCVTATALRIPFEITGLSTLKVKETDRLLALKKELCKIGCLTQITDDSIKSIDFFDITENIYIETYDDHRMAMSFAPFCLVKELHIQNEEVVEKSYPQFWSDLAQLLN